jgi:hypothetical protein
MSQISQLQLRSWTKAKNIADFCCSTNYFSRCTGFDDVIHLFYAGVLISLLLDNVTALLYPFYTTVTLALSCERYESGSWDVLRSSAATDSAGVTFAWYSHCSASGYADMGSQVCGDGREFMLIIIQTGRQYSLLVNVYSPAEVVSCSSFIMLRILCVPRN